MIRILMTTCETLPSLSFARAVTLCATLTAVLATPVQAEALKAHYSLSLVGISFGSAFASATIDPKNYRIDVSTKTTGLANLVNNTKVAATATGGFADVGPTPATFANSIANTNETRTVRMALAGNSVRALEVKPEPWDAAVRVPVTEAHKRHVLDPVSALIMSVPPGEEVGPSACNRTIAVFDGVVRFDVSLSFVEVKQVKTRGYAGPVSVCTARYTPISGYRPDSSATKYMADNREMVVWLAPLTNAHVVVPYHIAIKTSAGTLMIDAADFQIAQR